MLWRFKMETLLKARELWGSIDGTKKKLYEKNEKNLLNYSRKDNRDLNLLVQSLSNNQFMNMQRETITRGIWETLAKHHIDEGLANKNNLTRKYFMSQMNPLDTMEFHFNKLVMMANKLNVIDVGVLDEVKAMVLLISLLESY
jgi:hypothetical protein